MVQSFYAFCDSLHREDDGRLGGLTFYDSINVYPENGYLLGQVAQEHRSYNFHSQRVNCRMAKR